MNRLGAVVLAAGSGTRLGGPKGALLWNGELLLGLHARAFAGVVGDVVLAVSPQVEHAIGSLDVWHAELAAHSVKLHVVGVTTAGPYETLLLAVKELPSHVEALWVTHVDTVPASQALLSTMRDRYVSQRPEAMKPIFKEEPNVARGGHPVLVRRSLIDARFEHLRACLASIEVDPLETDDRRILSSINTRGEFEKWLGHEPVFARGLGDE